MPALITPFDEGREIDSAAHRHNLQHQWEAGIRGFLIGGSTGEGPYLEPGERRQLVSEARDVLGHDAYLSCGVAAETVRQAQAMIEEVAEVADSALVITPTTLTRNRPAYVEGYYIELAEWSPVPILLYSVPPVTAYELEEEIVVRLSQHPNISGIKDSGGHPVRLQRFVATVASDFSIFTGSTQAVSLAIAAGAHGAITASANYMPKRLLEVIDAAKANANNARALQAEISRLSAVVEAQGIPGIKAAADLAGLQAGRPRGPLQPLPSDLRQELEHLLIR